MRRALGPAGRDLATLEGGYRLTVPRGGLDVCRFEDALATAARLEELRAAAAERQAELQLSLGRAEEAVAALGALLAEHPEREQARGLPCRPSTGPAGRPERWPPSGRGAGTWPPSSGWTRPQPCRRSSRTSCATRRGRRIPAVRPRRCRCR